VSVAASSAGAAIGPALSEDSLRAALTAIAPGASARDRCPAFPDDAMGALAGAGVLGATLPGAPAHRRPGREWGLVRRTARVDGSVGRILDGHLNAVERVVACAPDPLRERELAEVAAGRLWLGVWGADPVAGEGPPARVVDGRLIGVKTFCSGAGGVHRAIVLARGPEGPPLAAYVDLSDGVEVDRSWFRGAGMRASESHRVVFSGARVLCILGDPGELGREPLFSRDAIRTAALWAGVADAAAASAVDEMAARPTVGALEGLAAGRIALARQAIDLWLDEAAHRAEQDPQRPLRILSVQLRVAIAQAARTILDEAARGCGSRPFARPTVLERARRDLELFLLQHRLDPMLARLGQDDLEGRG